MYLGLRVLICLNMLSIETINLNISKTDISTVKKISTVNVNKAVLIQTFMSDVIHCFAFKN